MSLFVKTIIVQISFSLTSVTRPAAIVAPADRNMNRPRSLKSLYNSMQIGLSTSSSITALVFFVKHLQTQNV